MRKLSGRLKTVHLKEHGKDGKAPIGEGDVRWDEVFKICETTGGTEWYVVEQEQYRDAPIDAVAACIKNLRKMGK
jgi:sugar phosphate isomerase/epimerase